MKHMKYIMTVFALLTLTIVNGQVVNENKVDTSNYYSNTDG